MTWEEFCKGMREEPPEEWHGAYERLSKKEVIALTFAARIAQSEVSLKAFADELVKRMDARQFEVDYYDCESAVLWSNFQDIVNKMLHEAGVPQ